MGNVKLLRCLRKILPGRPGLTKWKGRVCEELAATLVRLEGRGSVEALRMVGEAGRCRRTDSQQEQAAFAMRLDKMMNG